MEIVLSLILTLFFYMIVPVVLMLVNHGRFDKKKAKRIALWNSIVVGAGFLVVTSLLSEGNTAWHAGPAILYYWINRAILTDGNATSSSWKISVIALNSNRKDRESYQKEIRRSEPVYFHLEVSGKKSKVLTRILVDCTLPNGNIEMDTFDGQWRNGDRLVYTCDPRAYGVDWQETGVLKCDFSDKDGNFLGTASVNIIE